jgi:acyl transferase domain-containing protein
VVLVLARLADAEAGRPADLRDPRRRRGVAVRAADEAIGEARAAQGSSTSSPPSCRSITARARVHGRGSAPARDRRAAQDSSRASASGRPTLPRLSVPPATLRVERQGTVPRSRSTRRDPNGPADGARLVIVAASDAELARRIDRARRHLLEGPGRRRRALPSAPAGGHMAFVYTGAGAAYAGMGDELLLALPELVPGLASRFEGLEKALGWAYEDARTPPSWQKLWGASALCQLHTELSARSAPPALASGTRPAIRTRCSGSACGPISTG